MTDRTVELDKAIEFLNSPRGKYIAAQAFYHAIKAMEAVKNPHKEISNISDMRFIRDNLFPYPDEIFERMPTP